MTATYIDTHCHLHDPEYGYDISMYLQRASDVGVGACICIGTDIATSRMAGDVASKYPQCYCALGIHPHRAGQIGTDQLRSEFLELSRLAESMIGDQKLVAIGEIGLDYHYHADQLVKDRQKQLLQWQLQLAIKLNLPVVFHVRSAFNDFWPIYDDYKMAGVLHSFSDTPETVAKALEYEQLYFGLNGIVTFSQDKNQLQAFKDIPSRRILLETDSPYLTPVPFRGKVNESYHIPLICKSIAELKAVDEVELAQSSTELARVLFNRGF